MMSLENPSEQFVSSFNFLWAKKTLQVKFISVIIDTYQLDIEHLASLILGTRCLSQTTKIVSGFFFFFFFLDIFDMAFEH